MGRFSRLSSASDMLLIYLILVVWLAVLTHRLICGDVPWTFLILSIVCCNLILAIWLDTSPKEEV